MKGFAYQLVKTSMAVAACSIYPIQPQTWHARPNTAQPANSAYNDLCILALLHSRKRMPPFQAYWAKLLRDMLEVQLSLLPGLPLAYTHIATDTTRPEHEACLCLWEGWLQNQHYRENHRYTECMDVIWYVPIGGLWLCKSNKPKHFSNLARAQDVYDACAKYGARTLVEQSGLWGPNMNGHSTDSEVQVHLYTSRVSAYYQLNKTRWHWSRLVGLIC